MALSNIGYVAQTVLGEAFLVQSRFFTMVMVGTMQCDTLILVMHSCTPWVSDAACILFWERAWFLQMFTWEDTWGVFSSMLAPVASWIVSELFFSAYYQFLPLALGDAECASLPGWRFCHVIMSLLGSQSSNKHHHCRSLFRWICCGLLFAVYILPRHSEILRTQPCMLLVCVVWLLLKVIVCAWRFLRCCVAAQLPLWTRSCRAVRVAGSVSPGIPQHVCGICLNDLSMTCSEAAMLSRTARQTAPGFALCRARSAASVAGLSAARSCHGFTMGGAQITVLRCGHQYHSYCIAAALEQSRRCPTCRAPLPPEASSLKELFQAVWEFMEASPVQAQIVITVLAAAICGALLLSATPSTRLVARHIAYFMAFYFL